MGRGVGRRAGRGVGRGVGRWPELPPSTLRGGASCTGWPGSALARAGGTTNDPDLTRMGFGPVMIIHALLDSWCTSDQQVSSHGDRVRAATYPW